MIRVICREEMRGETEVLVQGNTSQERSGTDVRVSAQLCELTTAESQTQAKCLRG